jgi:hypothetical protein
MSWRKIPMKFPGICIVCKKKIATNEIGLWSKGLGVKHEQCAQINELQCIVCKNSAGCLQCEFQDICEIQKVSQLCICKTCSEGNNSFNSYQQSVKKSFLLLNSSIQNSKT